MGQYKKSKEKVPMASFAAVETFVARLGSSGASAAAGLFAFFIGSRHFYDQFVTIEIFAIHPINCLFCIAVIVELLVVFRFNLMIKEKQALMKWEMFFLKLLK